MHSMCVRVCQRVCVSPETFAGVCRASPEWTAFQNAVILASSRWTHFESASRSLAKVPAELPRFRELWTMKLGGRRCIDPYSSRWRELRRAV